MNYIELEEFILIINNRTGIRVDILEKDYYVCLILKDLASKQDKLQAYFKGGTAIYKILKHMNRFSEDIDLTVKIDKNSSKNSNKTRLRQSALDYKIVGLELIKEETINKKGSITSFYKYKTLFNLNELFKMSKIQVEATSFTVSEPISTYAIEPLIYKYATKAEKQILKEKYNISDFQIKIIKLERIFIDKIFAAEFYYLRKIYEDVAKHLYDICIIMRAENIKELLNNKTELKRLIEFKRKEEKARIGGIDANKKIYDFEYMKLEFNDEMLAAIARMQKAYVLDTESIISITEIKKAITILLKSFKNF